MEIIIVGIGIPLILFLFAWWISDSVNKQTDKHLRIIRESNLAFMDCLKRSTCMSLKFLVRASHEELRNRYKSSSEENDRFYWHFRWRFETYDRLGIQVIVNEKNTNKVNCYYDIYIKGTSNRPDQVGFEHQPLQNDVYVAEIIGLSDGNPPNAPFKSGEYVSCFIRNGKTLITLGDGFDDVDFPSYPFQIGGLGFRQGGSMKSMRTAKDVELHDRTKELPATFESEIDEVIIKYGLTPKGR